MKDPKNPPARRGRPPKEKRSAALAAMGPIPPDSEFEDQDGHLPGETPEERQRRVDALDNRPSPGAYSTPTAEKSPVRRVVAKSAEDAWTQIMAAIVCQVEALCDKHKEKIQAAYVDAIEGGDEDNDHKKKYTFGLSPSITGDDPTHYTVKTKISYASKTVDSEEDQVAVGADLVDLMAKPQEID